MKTVNPGNSLNQVVPFQWLVDVQHRVFWLIKSGQQLVHHNQHFQWVTGIAEAFNQVLGVALLILVAHIRFPPLSYFRAGSFIHRGITLAGVGRAHHHSSFEQIGLIKILLVLDSRSFAVAGQLTLQAIVDVLYKMVGDIHRNQANAVIYPVGLSLHGELTLEVSFLLTCQPFGNTLNPAVGSAFIHLQIRNALFIEQGRYRTVFNGTLHGVGVDDGAKLVGGLVILEKRRTSERDKGRVRQRLLHTDMVFTALATVALIDQDDDIRAGVYTLWHFGSGIKFLDEREDNPLSTFANLLGQAFARGSHRCFFVFFTGQLATGCKGFAQLALQIYPVGHYNNAALFQVVMQNQRLAEKHHGEGLAGTCGVPDHTTFTPAIRPARINTVDQPLDAKHLLVASNNLARLLVV